MVDLYDIKLQLTTEGDVQFSIASSEEVRKAKAELHAYMVVEDRFVKDIEQSILLYIGNVLQAKEGGRII